jgi:hypothetical protein
VTTDAYRGSLPASPDPCAAVWVRGRRRYIAVILLYLGSLPTSVALTSIGTCLFGDRGAWVAVVFLIVCAVRAYKLMSMRCPHCAVLLARHRWAQLGHDRRAQFVVRL